MSKRHGNVLFVIFLVLALLCGVAAGTALVPSVTPPYVTTTLYGKGPGPEGITDGVNGDIICDPNTSAAVHVDPYTRGIHNIDDEGQQVSVVAWPNEQRDIVLELTRAKDTGSVWSYRAVIARNGNGITGLGGLDPIGVISQKVQIKITIGIDQPVPTNLTLCRLVEGVG